LILRQTRTVVLIARHLLFQCGSRLQRWMDSLSCCAYRSHLAVWPSDRSEQFQCGGEKLNRASLLHGDVAEMSGQPFRNGEPPAEWSDSCVEFVLRRCKVCDWEGEVIERPGSATDCPWCHGPTDWHATIASSRNIVPMIGEKNPHATTLGRLGGLKGGRARAEALTATERRRIATRAARARWARKKPKTP